MGRSKLNLAVGLFVVLGIMALAYLSIQLGKISALTGAGYTVVADFPSVAGLKKGAAVEIAGVGVGRVDSIRLHDYQARVIMRMNGDVQLQEDSIASIKSKGLIGEKYVRISPGASDKIIGPGGRIRDVEAPVDLEELIAKYIFGKV